LLKVMCGAACTEPPDIFGPIRERMLTCENIVKRYSTHTALDGVSMDVPAGKVFGLLGPNGAGKTTLIRIITRITGPDSGRVLLDGHAMTDADVARMGYLPEERGLYKKMKVGEQALYLARLKGMDKADASKKLKDWFERWDLAGWWNKKVEELSKGMQQKVQFIGTLLHDPDLVILDEPFSGLDPINAQGLKDTVVDLKRRGKTVIFSTHLMDNAERMCDAVCIIARGEKVLDGAVSAVKAEHGAGHLALQLAGASTPAIDAVLADASLVARVDDSSRFFEIELAPGGDGQQLLRRLVEAGASIDRFERISPSLHQIFLQKVGARGIEPGMSGHG